MLKKDLHMLNNLFSKYLWVGLFTLFITLAVTTQVANAQSIEQLNKELFSTAVQIGDFCSGNIIHSERDKISGEVETIILTAKHCLINKSRTTVNIIEYDKNLRKIKTNVYEATNFGMSYKSDLALLKLKDTNTVFLNVARIAPADIELTFGQTTFIASYPKGLSLTYTVGSLGFVEIMDGFSSASISREFYRSSPDVKGGSSGGGLFVLNGDKLELIGVTTGGWNDSTFMNYFTPIDEIRDYWDIAKRALKTTGQ
jgi:S1-C subfamily serine protease